MPDPTRGRAQQFRDGSWLERCVDRLRGSRTAPAPQLLRSIHEAVLDRWPGDHLVSTLPNGERVRLAARYRTLSWNPDEYRAFRQAIRQGATVFDVGANLGAYTLLFGQWVGAAGRVVAFEPSAASRSGLARHVHLNDLEDRVEDRVRRRDRPCRPGTLSHRSIRWGEQPPYRRSGCANHDHRRHDDVGCLLC